MTYAIYGQTKVEFLPGVTVEGMQSILSSIYPEVENAVTSIDPQGNVVYTVATATKGR